MAKVLVIDHEKCTSCRLCEMVCSERHGGAYRPCVSRVRVAIYPEKAVYLPQTCVQCEDAPCMEVCPSEALVRDPDTSAVLVVEENCTGCGACESACPFGAVHIWDDKAHICDLCGGDPECVKFCVPQALRYETPDESVRSAQQAYADHLRDTLAEVKG